MPALLIPGPVSSSSENPAVRQVPIALVSLVDKDRQWFKARVGLNVCETSRELAFCAHSILPQHGDLFEVPDARADCRFKHSALVTGEPYIRFYAGAPLEYYDSSTNSTVKLGTLCIIDTTPRSLTDGERAILKTLSRLAVAEIQLRHQIQQERKAALDQAQQSAFSLAKDLNSSYISQVAHDLRTPLNSFSLGLQELMESGLSRKQQALADAMETSAELMQLTCSKVLDLTALEHGKELKIDLKTFDIVDVLRKRCATLQYTRPTRIQHAGLVLRRKVLLTSWCATARKSSQGTRTFPRTCNTTSSLMTRSSPLQ